MQAMPPPMPAAPLGALSGDSGAAGQPSSSLRSSMLYAPLLSSFSAVRLGVSDAAASRSKMEKSSREEAAREGMNLSLYVILGLLWC